jgi:hypothetical protein
LNFIKETQAKVKFFRTQNKLKDIYISSGETLNPRDSQLLHNGHKSGHKTSTKIHFKISVKHDKLEIQCLFQKSHLKEAQSYLNLHSSTNLF